MNNIDLLNLIIKLMKPEEKNNTIDNSLINEYVIVRTYSAGVFAGTLKSRKGREVILTNARRIWSWAGAASLSQLAEKGSSKPKECKFPCPVEEVLLLEVIEILKVSKIAEENIKSVPIWME